MKTKFNKIIFLSKIKQMKHKTIYENQIHSHKTIQSLEKLCIGTLPRADNYVAPAICTLHPPAPIRSCCYSVIWT